MNLFQKYGIKEVADVVFYSMKEVGDEIVETPVLYLDTLKVSTLEKTASSAFAQGGLKNKKLIKWNFGKDIKLTLEDALFSPASMSMIWGGKLQSKLGTLTDIIAKINYANIYGKLRYSTKAYPSPSLTDDEWEIVFKILNKETNEGYEYIVNNEIPTKMTEKDKNYWVKRYYSRPTELIGNDGSVYTYDYDKKNGFVIEDDNYLNIPETNGEKNDFIKNYYTDSNTGEKKIINPTIYANKAMPEYVAFNLRQLINELSDVGEIETSIGDAEVVDRMEKCIVKDRNGLEISTKKQLDNLFRYYSNDKSSSYTIYYDAKTMLPLFRIEDGKIDDGEDEFTIKMGTVYYKWTRTVKYKESENDAILGKTLVIDAETFPDAYKIVGETYIRNQKTGKDQRYQFTIFRANVSSDTSVTLEAEGDPTTFSMQIDVLTPPNDIMMELKQYDVEDDPIEGGTRIVPQKSKYTYTPANIEYIEEVAEKNEEIY